MKLLLMTGSYAPERGGIASFIQGLAGGLTALGHDARILSAIPGSQEFSTSDLPVSEFVLPEAGYFRRVRACRRAIDKTKHTAGFDRVIASSWSPFAVGLSKTVARVTDVLCHGMDLLEPARSVRYRFLMRYTAGRISHLIANSNFTAKAAVRLTGQARKVSVVHPGIDTAKFSPGSRQEQLLARHGIASRAPIILSVGRLVERKGFDTVIAGFPAILREFPDAVYVLAGEGPDKARLQELAGRAGVATRVCFAGEVSDSDLVGLYRSSDVFVMPSRYVEGLGDVEGFGIVFLEAASCGVPAVGGRSGGIEDAIENGRTGFIADPMDSSDVCARICTLLRDAHLRRSLGSAARKRAVEQFDWPVVAARYLRSVSADNLMR